jgi:hypothetical protein
MTNFIDYIYIYIIPLYEISLCCCVCNSYNFIRGGTCEFVCESNAFIRARLWDSLLATWQSPCYRERGYPFHFRVEVWFYTVGDNVADPYSLPIRPTNRRWCDLLVNVLMRPLTVVSVAMTQHLWRQLDGTQCAVVKISSYVQEYGLDVEDR